MALAIKHLYEFGAFHLDATERVLRRRGDNEIVSLTPKVFSTLLLLVENGGRIVSKEEMMSALWPDAFVEESNLTFNVTKLRKALGDDAHECSYIETVPRRGYRFKAEVKEVLTENFPETKPEIRSAGIYENGNAVSEWPEKEMGVSVSVDARREATITSESATATGASGLAGRTKKRSYLIAAAVAVALSLSVGAAAWKYTGANRERDGLLSAFARGEWGALPALRYEQLTLNGSTREAAISPDGKYIVYTQESSSQRSLWLRRLATSQTVQLIPPADTNYGQLIFSRDGTQIFYVLTEPDNLKTIYRVSTFGGPPTVLIREVKTSFALSPDESQIVFSRRNASGAETLLIANTDGTNERELIRRERPERIDSPAWSPDGRTIVCIAGHSETSTPSMSMIEIDVASGAERVLLRPDWFNVGSTQWLPDGGSLLVRVLPRLASTGNQLWLVSYPEGHARRLTEDLNNYLAFSLSADASRIVAIQTRREARIWVSPNERGSDARQVAEGDDLAWTSDGQIVYSSTVGGDRDIWIMRADGSEQRQLTVSPGSDASPVVSPDNRYIVFSSDRTGAHHLWRMNLDGSNQVQLTNGFGEKIASISPDSRTVFYNVIDHQDLWRVSIEGGEPVRLTGDHAPYPSVSPDGRFIAYFQFAPETNEPLVAVRALDDSQAVRTFRLAPGRWASSNLRWNSAGAVIYARESEGQVRLYRQALDSSPPQQIAAFAAEDDFHFSWSPDGRRFAFARGDWQHDAVLIRISE